MAIPAEYDSQQIKDYLKTDKKTIDGRPFFVLPTQIGKVVVTDDVEDSLVDQVVGLK